MNFKQLMERSNILSKNITKITKYKTGNLLQFSRDKTGKLTNFVLTPLKIHVTKTVQFVDDTLGVSQVNEAQDKVFFQEAEFLAVRENVHTMKQILDEKQDALHETRKKLDRVDRGDERYLTYVADEHSLLLEVKKMQRDFSLAEERERQEFIEYSSAVRLSHEKERSRVERTKYWSIIGSITGTCFGFMFSSLITHYRLKRMREMTSEAITQASSEVHNTIENQTTTFLQQVQLSHDSVLKNISLIGNSMSNNYAMDESSNSEGVDTLQNDKFSLFTRLDEGIQKLVKDNKDASTPVFKIESNIESLREQFRESRDTEDKHAALLQSINEGIQRLQETSTQSLDTLKTTASKKLDVNTQLLNNHATELGQADDLPLSSNKGLSDDLFNIQTLNLLLAASTLAFVVCTSPHFYW